MEGAGARGGGGRVGSLPVGGGWRGRLSSVLGEGGVEEFPEHTGYWGINKEKERKGRMRRSGEGGFRAPGGWFLLPSFFALLVLCC